MTAPWFKARVKAWPTIRQALIATGEAWDDECIWTDLEWWADQIRVGREAKLPSRRTLQKEWGVSDWAVRKILREVWEPMRPKMDQPTANPRPTHRQPTTNPNAEDQHAVFSENQPTANPPPTHDHPTHHHTRDSTEHRAQSTEEEGSASPPTSPAEPVPPSASEPPEQTTLVEASPLWEQLGCPPPNEKVKPKHLTKQVLEIYAAWWKRYDAWRAQHCPQKGVRAMDPSDLTAIASALTRKPSAILSEEQAVRWPIERLVKATLAYPMAIGKDDPRGWVQNEVTRWMRPSFTLRNGAARPQWEEAAQAAVALAERSQVGGPALQVLDGGKPATVDLDALTLRLWNAYYNGPNRHRAELEKVLGGREVYDEWIRVSRRVLHPMAIPTMQGSDLPFRKRDYVKTVRAWLAESVKAVA